LPRVFGCVRHKSKTMRKCRTRPARSQGGGIKGAADGAGGCPGSGVNWIMIKKMEKGVDKLDYNCNLGMITVVIRNAKT
jgi:hypothetical protein